MRGMKDENDDWSDIISPEDLKRELSLSSYVEEQLSELYELNPPSAIAETRQRLETFVREIECHAQAGDSWWEWEWTEPKITTGGLAVVRNCQIVWATMTWIR
jgi:hypothetical protein